MKKISSLHIRRTPGQTVVIGEGDDRVTLLVEAVDGDQVNLIFKAPREVKINRSEILGRGIQ